MKRKSISTNENCNLTRMDKLQYKEVTKAAKYFIADTIIKGSAENFNQFKVLWTPGVAVKGKFPIDIFKEEIASSYHTRIIIDDSEELVIDISFDHLAFPEQRPKKINQQDTIADCGFIHIHEMNVVIGLQADFYDLTFSLNNKLLLTDETFEDISIQLPSLKNYLEHAAKLAKYYLHIWYCLQITKEPSIRSLFSPVFLMTFEDRVPRELLIKQGSTNRIKTCKNIWLTDTNSIVNVMDENCGGLVSNDGSKRLWRSRGYWCRSGKHYERGGWKGAISEEFLQ